MFYLLLLLATPTISIPDQYSEQMTQIRLLDKSYLIELRFGIDTAPDASTDFLDIFPQPIATVLSNPSARFVQANFVRGTWRKYQWGTATHEEFPSGSSMFAGSSDQISPLWPQAAWMFSTTLGGSFESLDPLSSKQYKWIKPFDVVSDVENIRMNANPNEPCCSENLERFIELLPCRGKRGLAKRIESSLLDLAASEYMGISVRGSREEGSGVLRFEGRLFFRSARQWAKLNQDELCLSTVPDYLDRSDFESKSTGILVARSLISTKNRPERIQGKLLVHISNSGVERANVQYFDQFPFFLTPLWHTEKLSFTSANSHLVHRRIKSGDGVEEPTRTEWELNVAPGDTVTIEVEVYKRFIAVDKFSFSFEKGFDIGSGLVWVNKTQWFLTRGLVTVTAQPDATATFNVITLSCTVVSLFFGMGFRNWAVKRSIIVGTDKHSMAEKQAPIVRLLTWLVSLVTRRND